jgi:hypothetical protein
LFVLEGSLTVVVAFVGFFWLPHSVDTAWFLTPEERKYASTRVIRDRHLQSAAATSPPEEDGERVYDDESRGLLNSSGVPSSSSQERASLDDRGLTPRDIFSSVFNAKIWHILACNVLSATPVYAFSVFLPLVLAPLTQNSTPALINLLTAPPHICGAIVLFVVAHYSDKYRIRLIPVLFGLIVMVIGLIIVVILPLSWAIPRYLALNVLLSGTYIASPLTVAWISGNTPSPGKRALLLGINGWGNLGGILAAMMFKPRYAASGYLAPFWWTLACVALSALGFVLFLRRLHVENEMRRAVLDRWSEEDIQMENEVGKGPLRDDQRWMRNIIDVMRRSSRLSALTVWLEEATQGGREGDEKISFVYGL